jgi:membrane fusion protein, heavy metal efflux system
MFQNKIKLKRINMFIMHIKSSVFLLFTLLICISCNKTAIDDKGKLSEIESTEKITLNNKQLNQIEVSTGLIEEGNLSEIVKLNGKIDVPPQNLISISMPLGGFLKYSKLLPGMHVRKGEVLAILEDQQYIQLQQDYLLAKMKIKYAELELNRQQELNITKASSDKNLQLAESEVQNYKIILSALAEKLKIIGLNPINISTNNISKTVKITAPINGFISKVNVNIGKYIAPTDVMFELIDPSDIHLALKVFEKDIPKLYIGQKLLASTNSKPDNIHECEILLIGMDINEEHNTEVHCHFEKYDKSLIPGTYMNAEIKVKSSKNYVLNENAVVAFESKQYVFTKKNENNFDFVEVQTGVVEGGKIEIKNGKQLIDKQIVTKGAYALLMSLKNKAEE